MIGIVLAGGTSSRLQDLSDKSTPKCMKLLNDHDPVIYYSIKLVNLDTLCDKIYVVCDHGSDIIKNYFKNNIDKFNCDIIVDDKHTDAGTGGSLYYIYNERGINRAIVLYANTLAKVNIEYLLNDNFNVICYLNNYYYIDNYKFTVKDKVFYLDESSNNTLANIMILDKEFIDNSPDIYSFSLEEFVITINSKIDVPIRFEEISPSYYRLVNTFDDVVKISSEIDDVINDHKRLYL